ncbi:histidine phosphatase family protein [Desulfovibrio sp. JC010]|uniref:histidine phosphatase family protein n=1 Tax=Desulfovibrio sp. JC010 TaxID=2593641 RepID=UPI0013D60AD4|nr:histidine phosphatase family protein [Desulfovibrio sp. JC010]NDV25935.1 histidine phosphatase family protein [Desulfovibrio sp. JC010]
MIILIRHGEIEGAKGRAVGQIDLPLSEKGLIQSAQLAESLASFRPSHIYCSPLSRTVQTASFIEKQCGMEAVHVPEIKEISLGNWEGQSFSDIKSSNPEEFTQRGADLAGFRPRGGESFNDLKKRVADFLRELDEEGPLMTVTHAGVIRTVLHIVLGFPLDNIFRMKPDYCHATVIERKKGGFLLKAYNLPPEPGLGRHLSRLMPD